MKRILLVGVCAVIFCTGCSWVGQTAGKVQAKVERKTGAVEDGYHQGYSDEKAKTGSK